jgi:BASS family bile acid:Na+ symporter
MEVVQVVNLLAAVTLIEMMVTLGLGVKASDVVAVGKQWDFLSRAFLANYVLVPGAALGLLLLFHASPMVAAGFLVAAVCPGAPYAPPFTSMAKGDVTLAVGLMIVLSASSAILAPVLLGLLLPLAVANTVVKINVLKMIGTLLGAQLLPLCVGLWISSARPQLAQRLERPGRILSLCLNLLLLVVIVSVQFQTLAEIRLRGYVGMMCLVLATLLAGALATRWPLGKAGKSMIVTTSVRNVGVSLVIATASFPGTAAITSATAYAIFQTVTIAMVALAWGRLTPNVPAIVRKAA